MHRRHFILTGGALLAGCATGGPARLAPGSTIYITRHGDRSGDALSATGRVRARALVEALDGMPLDAIYSPGIQRNLDTAAPIAAARGLIVERRPQESPTARLAQEASGRSVLWVGNKGNITEIWENLGLPGEAALDYGVLSIVRSDSAGRVTLESINYGQS